MIRTQVEERNGARAELAKKVAVWGVALLVAAFLASAGLPKLSGGAIEQFAGWGYPGWFSYVIGAVEVGGAALLLFPRLAAFAAAVLAADMVGAFFTRLTNGEFSEAALPVVLLVLLAVVGAARRPPLLALARRFGRRW